MSDLNIARSVPQGAPGMLLDGAECRVSVHGPERTPGIETREKPQALSFSQRQVWVHAQLASGVPLYHSVLTLSRRGPLHQGALEQALREIVRRHESLRTTFALSLIHI